MFATACDTIKEACDSASHIDWDKTVNALRYFRNNCTAGNSTLQNQLRNHPTLIGDCLKLLNNICSSSSDSETVVCLRVAIQFLCNYIVSNEINDSFHEEQFFHDIMSIGLNIVDIKARNYFAMLARSFILNHSERTATLLRNKDLITILIEDVGNGLEFPMFLIETIINQGYFQALYANAGPHQRLILLEVIHTTILDNHDTVTSLDEESIFFLTECFKKKSDCILKTVSSYAEELEPREVAKLLSVICSLSGSEPYLEKLQKDRSLFINCAYLLKSIHSIGKQGLNQFSVDGKNILPTKEMETEPTFSFKADIIRLIGNMAYRNLDLQNLARELECIPFLLDCCKIDAKNPFILQWCIFAIRNLCEHNKENQAVISSFEKQSEIDPSLISQLGLTLQLDDGKSIGIMPLIK